MDPQQNPEVRSADPPTREVREDALDAASVQAAIARAKHEWECTADALPDLVCLLDGRGRVVRANRVVERWALGSVAEVIGRSVHELLHPHCEARSCALNDSLRDGWSKLRDGSGCEFEVWDSALERALQITLRPMPPNTAVMGATNETLAVMVVADITPLHLAQEALRSMNAGLEAHVRSRTLELADANRDLQNEVIRRETAEEALRASRNDLALLSNQLMVAQEIERRRIARELHDSVGQALTAIKYALERGMELARQGRLPNAQPVLRRAIAGLQNASEEIRAIAMNLRPSMLDDLGAASAVAWFCREFSENYPLIELQTEMGVSDGDIPQRLSTAVFRSVQELLNNVAKHAQARHAVVWMSRDESHLMLEVRDDGVGIEQAHSGNSLRVGHGIRNLRERAKMTGGQLTLSSGATGNGTRARVEWRLKPEEAAVESAAQRPG
jgi:signal transduction histidine kinase